MPNLVRDVFKDYKEQNNILDAEIVAINLFKKSKKLELKLKTQESLKITYISSFEEYLKTRFQIEKISLNIEFGKKGDSPLFCHYSKRGANV